MTHPGPVLLILAALGGGCGRPPLKPLSSYNDLWRGELRLSSARVVRVQMTIAISRADDRAEREPPHDKRALVEIEVQGAGPVAALGTISHYNFAEYKRESHAPHPDREFVDFEVQGPGLAAATEDACAIARYVTALRDLMFQVRPAGLGDWGGTLQLLGERVQGNRIQGIVLLKLSRAGKCTHSVKGRCGMWAVEAHSEEVGLFALERAAVAAEIQHLSGREVRTRSFAMAREEEQPGSLSWATRFAPRRAAPATCEERRGE